MKQNKDSARLESAKVPPLAGHCSTLFGIWALALAFIAACGHRTSVAAPSADPPLASLVTGDAANALKTDGTFQLPDTLVHPRGEVSAEGAVRIGVDYVRDFGPAFVGDWVKSHGVPIDYAALRPCSGAFYARSAYEPLGQRVSAFVQRAFGPHWIVAFCQPNDGPAVVVTFSSLVTDLEDGRDSVVRNAYSQADFFSLGIPRNTPGRVTFSPEGAAEQAAALSGQRVSTVPQLIMPPRPYAAAVSRWRVTLEHPIQVKGSLTGVVRATRRLYVGFDRYFINFGLLDSIPQGYLATDSTHRFALSGWRDPKTNEVIQPVRAVGVPGEVEVVRRVTP